MELIAIVALCFGVSIGAVVMNLYWLRRRYGVFKIDCRGPDKDICRLELNSMDLDALARQNYIVLKIETLFDNSQE